MSELTWVVGDQDPPISLTLYESNGSTPVDLTNSSAVLKLSNTPGVLKVNAAMTIANAVGGVVTYAWAAADLDTVNSYAGEVEVTKATRRRTFRGFTVNVVATIG